MKEIIYIWSGISEITSKCIKQYKMAEVWFFKSDKLMERLMTINRGKTHC